MSVSFVGNDLFERLGAVAVNLSRYGHMRMELLRCELAEEREHLSETALHGALALLLMFSTIEFVVLLIVAWCWDTRWRLPVIGGIAALSLVATIVQMILYGQRRSRSSALFESSMDQFKKDSHLLEELK
jgi:uncharacterized membrane protein YqjE